MGLRKTDTWGTKDSGGTIIRDRSVAGETGSPASSLCFPDGQKTCFRCCPPIRPPHYDHLEYEVFLKREFREHTLRFQNAPLAPKPITGFTCWGLGYLDAEFRLVGCLLHPQQNGGKDLRFLVEYGEKCRLATCPEAETFARLAPESRIFWLHPCRGMDSFRYSSPRANPLFRLLEWGEVLLNETASLESRPLSTFEAAEARFPFLALPNPRGKRFLIEWLQHRHGPEILGETSPVHRIPALLHSFQEGYSALGAQVRAPYVHKLGLDPAFSDFLRLGLGLRRLPLEDALRLREEVEEALASTFF